VYKSIVWAVVCLVTAGLASAQTDSIKIDQYVDVRLVLLETLVLDGEGRTVTGLTRDDFQLAIDGTIVPIKTLDEVCPLGAVADVAPVKVGDIRETPRETPRKIVLLIDYFFLSHPDRAQVIEGLKQQIGAAMTPSDEFMVAAIAPRLRIEQRFTSDPQEVLDTLDRMYHDATLFAADLTNATGGEYLDALASLMDVLEPYPGAKAVVMYSAAVSRGDVTVASFENVARRAAGARTIIYPTRTSWMNAPEPRRGMHRPKGGAGGVRILPLLAIGTGGRALDIRTQDLSLSLARAQRDLACRHTLGFDLPSDQADRSHDVGISVIKPDLEVSYPVRFRLWSDEERRESRLRAAFVDPENFENTLVRAGVFPVRPKGKGWETLVTLHFPMPNDGNGNHVELKATLERPGVRKVEEYVKTFPVELSSSGSVPVTVFGDSPSVRPGPIDLTIALSRPGREHVVTAAVSTVIPPVPRKGDFILGPILARVLDAGVLIRADQDEQQEETALDRVLSHGQSIEPLLIHDIDATERLLVYWQACSADKKRKSGSVRIERTVYSEDEEVAYELDVAEVALEPSGKLGCGGKLDEIPANTLAPGRYRLEVRIVDGGKTLGSETTPLMVH